MDLAKAQELAESKMREWRLHEQGWKFAYFDGYSDCTSYYKGFIGKCNYRKKLIQLKTIYVKCNDEKEVLDTILHEIAHALAPKDANHDWRWKRMAIVVGATPSYCAEFTIRPAQYKQILVNKFKAGVITLDEFTQACKDLM